MLDLSRFQIANYFNIQHEEVKKLLRKDEAQDPLLYLWKQKYLLFI